MKQVKIENGYIHVDVHAECEGECSSHQVLSVPIAELRRRCTADELSAEIVDFLRAVQCDGDLKRRADQLLGRLTAPVVTDEQLEAYIDRKLKNMEADAESEARLLARLKRCKSLEGCDGSRAH